MAFPPKKPAAVVAIGMDDEEPMGAPADESGMPGSSKAAAAKALYSAFKEMDFEAAAAALGQFIDSHDDEMGEDEAEMPAEDDASPF